MKELVRGGILGVVALAFGLGGAMALAPATAKDIMGKLNKGPNSLFPNLKRELQKDEPDWADVQAQTREYASLAASLSQATPPKGEKVSWVKLTQDYAAAAKTMDDAARKKDKSAALSAHQKLQQACTACHQVHRK
jgi:hypothetical protein